MRCSMKKEEILQTVVNEFEKAHADYTNAQTERNLGRYTAMFDLLQAIPIYPDERTAGTSQFPPPEGR